MICNLKIVSAFSGENLDASGTIEVNGVSHSLSYSGSASLRGANCTVDGVEHFWSGSDVNTTNPEIEKAVEGVFDLAYKAANDKGFEDWTAEVVNGEVKSLVEDEDEDE